MNSLFMFLLGNVLALTLQEHRLLVHSFPAYLVSAGSGQGQQTCHQGDRQRVQATEAGLSGSLDVRRVRTAATWHGTV